MIEKWKDIEGYETRYEVSNYGRIRGKNRFIKNRYGKVVPFKGCILKPQSNRKGKGYLKVGLWSEKREYKMHYVHRLVAFAFIKAIPGKNTINHKDGNPKNNHVKNLEWCTQLENVQHAFKNGLMNPASGEKAGTAKLTWRIVDCIRFNYNSGMYTYKELANTYGVCIATIGNIINHKIWIK